VKLRRMGSSSLFLHLRARLGVRASGKDGELELELLHLQQNVETPETHVIHFVIQRAVEQVATGKQPNISHISQKYLNDSGILNNLHGHVNSWIKFIQSVIKLVRDMASCTASQEINFWLSLERMLRTNLEATRSIWLSTAFAMLNVSKQLSVS
jgi:hypothetical protein